MIATETIPAPTTTATSKKLSLLEKLTYMTLGKHLSPTTSVLLATSALMVVMVGFVLLIVLLRGRAQRTQRAIGALGRGSRRQAKHSRLRGQDDSVEAAHDGDEDEDEDDEDDDEILGDDTSTRRASRVAAVQDGSQPTVNEEGIVNVVSAEEADLLRRVQDLLKEEDPTRAAVQRMTKKMDDQD